LQCSEKILPACGFINLTTSSLYAQPTSTGFNNSTTPDVAESTSRALQTTTIIPINPTTTTVEEPITTIFPVVSGLPYVTLYVSTSVSTQTMYDLINIFLGQISGYNFSQTQIKDVAPNVIVIESNLASVMQHIYALLSHDGVTLFVGGSGEGPTSAAPQTGSGIHEGSGEVTTAWPGNGEEEGSVTLRLLSPPYSIQFPNTFLNKNTGNMLSQIHSLGENCVRNGEPIDIDEYACTAEVNFFGLLTEHVELPNNSSFTISISLLSGSTVHRGQQQLIVLCEFFYTLGNGISLPGPDGTRTVVTYAEYSAPCQPFGVSGVCRANITLSEASIRAIENSPGLQCTSVSTAISSSYAPITLMDVVYQGTALEGAVVVIPYIETFFQGTEYTFSVGVPISYERCYVKIEIINASTATFIISSIVGSNTHRFELLDSNENTFMNYIVLHATRIGSSTSTSDTAGFFSVVFKSSEAKLRATTLYFVQDSIAQSSTLVVPFSYSFNSMDSIPQYPYGALFATFAASIPQPAKMFVRSSISEIVLKIHDTLVAFSFTQIYSNGEIVLSPPYTSCSVKSDSDFINIFGLTTSFCRSANIVYSGTYGDTIDQAPLILSFHSGALQAFAILIVYVPNRVFLTVDSVPLLADPLLEDAFPITLYRIQTESACAVAIFQRVKVFTAIQIAVGLGSELFEDPDSIVCSSNDSIVVTLTHNNGSMWLQGISEGTVSIVCYFGDILSWRLSVTVSSVTVSVEQVSLTPLFGFEILPKILDGFYEQQFKIDLDYSSESTKYYYGTTMLIAWFDIVTSDGRINSIDPSLYNITAQSTTLSIAKVIFVDKFSQSLALNVFDQGPVYITASVTYDDCLSMHAYSSFTSSAIQVDHLAMSFSNNITYPTDDLASFGLVSSHTNISISFVYVNEESKFIDLWYIYEFDVQLGDLYRSCASLSLLSDGQLQLTLLSRCPNASIDFTISILGYTSTFYVPIEIATELYFSTTSNMNYISSKFYASAFGQVVVYNGLYIAASIKSANSQIFQLNSSAFASLTFSSFPEVLQLVLPTMSIEVLTSYSAGLNGADLVVSVSINTPGNALRSTKLLTINNTAVSIRSLIGPIFPFNATTIQTSSVYFVSELSGYQVLPTVGFSTSFDQYGPEELFSSVGVKYPGLLTYELEQASSLGGVDDASFRLENETLYAQSNSMDHHNLTVYLTDEPTISTSALVACNLLPAIGDIDIGAEIGLAIPPVTAPATFQVPLRINSGTSELVAFQITIQLTNNIEFVTLKTPPNSPWSIQSNILVNEDNSSVISILGLYEGNSPPFGLISGIMQFELLGRASSGVTMAIISSFVDLLVAADGRIVTEGLNSVSGHIPFLILPKKKASEVRRTANVMQMPFSSIHRRATPVGCTTVSPINPNACICSPILPGDADANCKVNVGDTIAVNYYFQQAIILGNSPVVSPQQLFSMDADGNGVINSIDVDYISGAIVGKRAFVSQLSTIDIDTNTICALTIEVRAQIVAGDRSGSLVSANSSNTKIFLILQNASSLFALTSITTANPDMIIVEAIPVRPSNGIFRVNLGVLNSYNNIWMSVIAARINSTGFSSSDKFTPLLGGKLSVTNVNVAVVNIAATLAGVNVVIQEPTNFVPMGILDTTSMSQTTEQCHCESQTGSVCSAAGQCIGSTVNFTKNSFVCNCSPGWTGELCDFAEPCPSNSEGINAICNCIAGYRGQALAISNQPPYYESTCTAQVCPTDSVGNNAVCTCIAGFMGEVVALIPENPLAVENVNYFNSSCKTAPCPANSYHPQATFAPTTAFITTIEQTTTISDAEENDNELGGGGGGRGGGGFNGGGGRRSVNFLNECRCSAGYFGDVYPTTNASEGYYNSTCAAAPCPTDSSGFGGVFGCSCNAGYEGQVTANENFASGYYTSTCLASTCPSFSEGLGGSGGCTCIAGYKGIIQPTNISPFYSGDCSAVTCPVNSNGENARCVCDAGYFGTVFANTSASDDLSVYYTSDCAPVQCPENGIRANESAVECQCIAGYNGTLLPSTTAPAFFTGSCEAVPCPVNSFGSNIPTGCPCNAGYNGSIGVSTNFPFFTGSCVAVACPANSNTDSGPSGCTCNAGFIGSVSVSTTYPFISGNCAAVACPTDSTGSNVPSGCTCNVGFSGSVSVRSVDPFYTSDCVAVACPVNSNGANTMCGCNPGYSGNVSAILNVAPYYMSTCAAVNCPVNSKGSNAICECDLGYDGVVIATTDSPSFYSSNCTVQSCPPNSNGSDAICLCNAGFAGSVAATYNVPPFYSSTCRPQICPKNSNGAFAVCNCNFGYSGAVLAISNSEPFYTSSCAAQPCPANSNGANTLCSCNSGFSGAIVASSNLEPFYVSNCSAQTCPTNSNGADTACVCNSGYFGSVIAISNSAPFYTSNCAAVACPANSRGLNSVCTCNFGYNGVVRATANTAPFYNSTCAAVPCPVNSIGANSLCTCNPGFSGSVTAISNVVPFYSSTCVAVSCPQDSIGTNVPVGCSCLRGFKGHVLVDSTAPYFISSCVEVKCPENSFGNATTACSCEEGYTGQPSWYSSSQTYNGTCVPIPRNPDAATLEKQAYFPAIIVSIILVVIVLGVLMRRRIQGRFARKPRVLDEKTALELLTLNTKSGALKNGEFSWDGIDDSPDFTDADIPLSYNSGISSGEESSTMETKTLALHQSSMQSIQGYFETQVSSRTVDGKVNCITTFGAVPKGAPGATYNVAIHEKNKPFNRYKDILPYDSTRVHLSTSTKQRNDYINANHVNKTVDGKNFSYIVTQGPLPDTIADFWRMTWENNSRIILMLTNVTEKGQDKCGQYWPLVQGDQGAMTYNDFIVTLENSKTYPGFHLRALVLRDRHTGEKRTIWHLHYNSWPDHGVPDDASNFLEFLTQMQSAKKQIPIAKSSPLVVHCSAGIGRSGVVILVELGLAIALSGEVPNMEALLAELREQRVNMVQTPEQYMFAHLAILAALKRRHDEAQNRGVTSF